jgi:hypothetical protein
LRARPGAFYYCNFLQLPPSSRSPKILTMNDESSLQVVRGKRVTGWLSPMELAARWPEKLRGNLQPAQSRVTHR